MTLSNSKKSTKLLLSIIIIITFLLSLGCYVLYHYQKENILIEKHNELAAISKLKVDQIVTWRKERHANALSIYNNQTVIIHINEYVHGIDPFANYLTITRWMKKILDEPNYSMVLLTDPSGKIIINTNPTKTIAESGHLIIEKAIMSKEIVFSDEHKFNDINVNIDLAIPLFLNPENHGGFVGVVFLRIDPEKFLYPRILSWPNSSRTSEIILVSREGDSVQYLSESHNNTHTVIHLRKSMTDARLISVQALTGKTGILESIDYNGIKVLGDAQHVPGSPWIVIAKIDISEFYHPNLILVIWIFVIAFLIIFISALIIYVVWTRQLNKSAQERKALLQHFEYVVKYANDIICLADLKGNIYEVNEKAVSTYGYKYEELLTLHLRQLQPTKTKDALDEQIKLLNEKDGYIYEAIHIRKNGEKFPVEVSGRIMVIKGEKYIQLIIRDISERNQANEKLRESEEGFRTLADSIPQMVGITRADGMNIYFNKRWTEYTGLTSEEGDDKGWNTPYHPDDSQRAMDAWNHAVETGEHFDLECRLRQYNGDYHWFVIMAEPLRDNLGNIIKWYGTFTNIDNRKQFEKEIKILNEELELKVNERTSQLQSTNKELAFQIVEKEKQAVELNIAKDKAEESDRLKTAFLANMSHEIRTPMNGIIGFTELLKTPHLTGEKQQKYISMIEKGGARMLNLINDLINISKIESGQAEVIVSKCNINEQIENIYSFFKPEVDKKGIQFFYQKSLPEKEAFIKTDHEKFNAILTNLVKNAIKYSDKGTIKLGYFLRKAIFTELLTGKPLENVSDPFELLFFIEDTGIGIPKEKIESIFNRFVQADSGDKRAFQGSGLGLSIAKAYVELLGGKIWVESEVGIGTKFYFTIPYINVP